MQQKVDGWVVVNENHPHTNSKYLIPNTFAGTRTQSINLFTSGSGQSWKYWYRAFNFRCVRAKMTITTE